MELLEEVQFPRKVLTEVCKRFEMPAYFDQHIIISGWFKRKGRKPYRIGDQDIFYDELIDSENSDYKLTVLIASDDRVNLSENSMQVFKVKMDYRKTPLQDGSIRIQAKVMEVLRSTNIPERKTVYTGRLEKRSKRDLGSYVHNKILSGRLVKVGLVVGKTSQVVADIKQAQRFGEKHVQIDFIYSNMSRPEQLIKDLLRCESQGYDVVGLARGGGSGLASLDDIALTECLLDMSPITVDATGHAEDLYRTSKAVDMRFSTPTDLGNYLSDVARYAVIARSKGRKIPQIEGKRLIPLALQGAILVSSLIAVMTVLIVYLYFKFK